MRRCWALLSLTVVLSAGLALGQARSVVEPLFSIWDVELGAPVSIIPAMDVNDLACGTNGGPPSFPLSDPAEFKKCKPEETGLREIHFSYDDELDYVARAMNSEYQVLQDGTSVFAHPVMVSVLAGEDAVIQGIRIMTDARSSLQNRRRSSSLIRNFEAKYKNWNLDCTDLPLAENEQKIGRHHLKRSCIGLSPNGLSSIRVDARYLRKPGQEGVNRETRKVNSTYFESFTRLEIVRLPFKTTPPPVRSAR